MYVGHHLLNRVVLEPVKEGLIREIKLIKAFVFMEVVITGVGGSVGDPECGTINVSVIMSFID